MRKSFDGLSSIVTDQMDLDLMNGDLFVFCNKRHNRIKILAWDGSGLCLYCKRLGRGTFAWPQSAEAPLRYSELELKALITGLDLDRPIARKRWLRR